MGSLRLRSLALKLSLRMTDRQQVMQQRVLQQQQQQVLLLLRASQQQKEVVVYQSGQNPSDRAVVGAE